MLVQDGARHGHRDGPGDGDEPPRGSLPPRAREDEHEPERHLGRRLRMGRGERRGVAAVGTDAVDRGLEHEREEVGDRPREQPRCEVVTAPPGNEPHRDRDPERDHDESGSEDLQRAAHALEPTGCVERELAPRPVDAADQRRGAGIHGDERRQHARHSEQGEPDGERSRRRSDQVAVAPLTFRSAASSTRARLSVGPCRSSLPRGCWRSRNVPRCRMDLASRSWAC